MHLQRRFENQCQEIQLQMKGDYLSSLCYNKGSSQARPQEIQRIMYLQLPKTTTDIIKLIGMVQYYRDMWKYWSHVLAPITKSLRRKEG